MELTNTEEAVQLYTAADKYDIPDICSLCVDYMVKNCTADNACSLYQSVNLWSLEEVLTVCKRCFIQNPQNSLQAIPYDQAETETINFIFGLDELEVESEHFLLEYLDNYIKANTSGKPNIRDELKQALKSIRFMTLGSEEIPKSLLSESEYKKVVSAIDNNDPEL